MHTSPLTYSPLDSDGPCFAAFASSVATCRDENQAKAGDRRLERATAVDSPHRQQPDSLCHLVPLVV